MQKFPSSSMDLLSKKQGPSPFTTGVLMDLPIPPYYVDEMKFDKKASDSDLAWDLRVFLRLGRFIGIMPLEGVFSSGATSWKLSFRKSGLAGIISVVCMALVFGNVVVGVIGFTAGDTRTNAAEYAWAPGMFLFYFTAFLGFYRFYRKGPEMIQIFRRWNSMELTYSLNDPTLFRDATLMVAILMTSAVAENILSSMSDLLKLPSTEEVNVHNKLKAPRNASSFEVYYTRSNENWAKLVPYNPIVATYVFLSNRIAWYGLNYMDLTTAILSRAIAFKFKQLYRQARSNLVEGPSGPSDWKELARDHSALTDLLSQVNALLSPIIFITFGQNLYQTCISLHLSLTPAANRSLMETIYSVWAFVHLMTRIFLVSLSAAKVNEWAHKVVNVLKKCPNHCYVLEVQRLEQNVRSGTIALTGLGCFAITKPFVLQIISVVFTFEIVLLQASQTPLTAPATGSG